MFPEVGFRTARGKRGGGSRSRADQRSDRIKGLRSLTTFRSGSASSCCTTSTLGAPCLGGGLPQRLHIARPVATIPPATISMSCFIAPSVQVGEAGKVPDGYDEKMVCHDRAGFGLQMQFR